MSNRVLIRNSSSQQGMALVIGLILLLVMTLMSIAAMRTTMMQERMAGSFQDNQRAFQAAETALREGEEILEQAALPSFNGQGLYESGDGRDRPDWTAMDAATDATDALEIDEDVSGVAEKPQYYIERLPAAPPPGSSLEAGTAEEGWELYRVTARGFGASDISVAVLESTFRR